jgi:hypothetical protein
MTSQGNGRQPVVYNVRLSEQNKQKLREHYLEAAQAGTGQRFLSALRRILDRLRTDPLTFGEPSYRLPALQLMVRQAVIAPIIVDYAVHDEQPIVFIRGFKVLS